MDDEFNENDESTQFDTLPDNAGVKILPPYIYLGFFALTLLMEVFLGANLFRWGAQLTIGTLLLSLGCGLVSWCFFLFTNKGTNLPPTQPALVLITDGPYRISRNPIYLGMSCIYLGATILFDLAWGMLLFVPLIYIIRKYVIAREEKYLMRKFRGDYAEYCATTRRWL